MIDLYAGPPNAQNQATVKLAYSDSLVPATPYGSINSWQRGNIWPKDKRDLPDQQVAEDTDVFANIPADFTVFANKGNTLFGFCGTVQEPELCLPLPEANQTYTDGKIWQPPPTIRGDQARALLYMAVRYSLLDENGAEVGLQLVDCPPYGNNQHGLLSAILEAHANDPPTQEEKDRNDRACSRWQGNRNPFIDEPSLATSIFGEPDVIREGFLAYERCFVGDVIETQAPTATPNECQSLEPGDIQIVLFNSDDPDQVAFYTLNNFPQDVGTLYVTDQPWNGTHLLENGEGTIAFTIPAETVNENTICNGLCPGALLSYGFYADSGQWEAVGGGNFGLGIGGDTILTYCINADGGPHFLHALTYSDEFLPVGLTAEAYGTEKSALPESLAQAGVGFVALPYKQNYIYEGPTRDLKDILLLVFTTPDYYLGNNDVRNTIAALDAPVTPSASPSSAPSPNFPSTPAPTRRCDISNNDYFQCIQTDLTQEQGDSCITCVQSKQPSNSDPCDVIVDQACSAINDCDCGACQSLVTDWLVCFYQSVTDCGSIDCNPALQPSALPSVAPSVSPSASPSNAPSTSAPTSSALEASFNALFALFACGILHAVVFACFI